MDCIEYEDRYVILAEPTSPRRACPHCGSSALIGHGKDYQRLHDLPCHGKQMVIQIQHQRFFCKQCHKTSFEPLPGIKDRHQMTERLVRYIERKAISTKCTFASIAEEIGIDPSTVRRICLDHIERCDQTRHFETPTVLGIDEIHLLHEPRGIMTNVESRTIIELLPDRRKATIMQALSRIKGHDQIRTVVIDCWRPYREAIAAVLPDAITVCDKFHILQTRDNRTGGIPQRNQRELNGYTETNAQNA